MCLVGRTVFRAISSNGSLRIVKGTFGSPRKMASTDFANSPSTISVNQGLSNAAVQSVLVARDGSVWLGSLDGLSRWNRPDHCLQNARR